MRRMWKEEGVQEEEMDDWVLLKKLGKNLEHMKKIMNEENE